MLHNIPEEWISHLHHNGILKSRIVRGDAGIPAGCWTASGILSEGCFDSCTSLWMISGISRNPLPSHPFIRCGLYWRNEWGSETGVDCVLSLELFSAEWEGTVMTCKTNFAAAVLIPHQHHHDIHCGFWRSHSSDGEHLSSGLQPVLFVTVPNGAAYQHLFWR